MSTVFRYSAFLWVKNMGNNQLLGIIDTFNIPSESALIVKSHLRSMGICVDKDISGRGNEISFICHIAKIIHSIKVGSTPSAGDDLASSFRDLMIEELESFFIPYDFIAYYIFQDEDIYEANKIEQAYNDIINAPNTTYFEKQWPTHELYSENDRPEKISMIFKKIQRHILLAIHQKQYILANIDQAKKDVVDLQQEIESLKISASELSDQAEELGENSRLLTVQADSLKRQADSTSKRLQHATGNYVAILGIFATIIFAVVGGINLFESAAKYIRLKNEFILYVSTGILTLSLIIYFLFTWVDRLSGGSLPKYPEISKLEYGVRKYGFFIFIVALMVIAVIAMLVSGPEKSTRTVSAPPYSWITDVFPDNVDVFINDRPKSMPSSTLRIELNE